MTLNNEPKNTTCHATAADSSGDFALSSDADIVTASIYLRSQRPHATYGRKGKQLKIGVRFGSSDLCPLPSKDIENG